jgi:hypothetical protein
MTKSLNAISGSSLHLIMIAFAVACAGSQHDSYKRQGMEGVVGQWDITVSDTDDFNASWLEVTHNQDKLGGRIVWLFGDVIPIPNIDFMDGQLTFRLTFMGEDLKFKAQLIDGKLVGTTERLKGNTLKWKAERSPRLAASLKPRWGDPIWLLNGRDLEGWKLRARKSMNCWSVAEGVMSNSPPCVDIISEQTFRDFKLHLEFTITEKSGSGVYLRGRYEVQIRDDFGMEPEPHGTGALFGYIPPTSNAAKPAGEWQYYDIILVGRQLTVLLNGKTIIENKEITVITCGALDSN